MTQRTFGSFVGQQDLLHYHLVVVVVVVVVVAEIISLLILRLLGLHSCRRQKKIRVVCCVGLVQSVSIICEWRTDCFF